MTYRTTLAITDLFACAALSAGINTERRRRLGALRSSEAKTSLTFGVFPLSECVFRPPPIVSVFCTHACQITSRRFLPAAINHDVGIITIPSATCYISPAAGRQETPHSELGKRSDPFHIVSHIILRAHVQLVSNSLYVMLDL